MAEKRAKNEKIGQLEALIAEKDARIAELESREPEQVVETVETKERILIKIFIFLPGIFQV